MTSPLRIGLAGLGTVGIGTVEVLRIHANKLATRGGRKLLLTTVSARDRNKDRGIDFGDCTWHDDAMALARDPSVDVVVELIGGAEGIARELIEAALSASKHVVTANKALIAHHGTALAHSAEAAGVALAYEAAVAGGVPIIKALREGLAGNRIDRISGILNGTCNYILTNMAGSNRSFDEVLAEAQALGYAESDPAMDVNGIDTAHKLAILASVGFGAKVDFNSVYVEGIRHISPIDIEFARELGYGIKLLGVAARAGDLIEQRVHPCMVPLESPMNHVSGVINAIAVTGDFVDTTIYEGRGAGAWPTASAVVADLMDIARGRILPTFSVPANDLKKLRTLPISAHHGPYYVRLMLIDKPGVFAEIAAILRDNGVSMESVLQRGRSPGEPVPVAMTVHETEEAAMQRTLKAIAAIDAVVEPPCMIRVETFL